MIRLLWLLAFLFFVSGAHAQTCPTRPPGDATNACASTKFVNTPATGGSFTPGLPVIGGASGGLAQGTRSGNTTGYMNFTGSFVNGDCLSVNNGNTIDAGGPCTVGGGGGTVAAGTTGQIGVYPSNGTTIAGVTPGTAGSTLAQMADVIYIANYVGTTGCKGNNAVDDSVAINQAITDANAIGGGVVRFSNGMDCRIANPIILKPYVTLEGPAPIVATAGAVGAMITPSADLTSMITQANLTTWIHSAGIRNLTLNGDVGTHTVTAMIEVWLLNGRIEHNYITAGSGTCLFFAGVVGGSNPDWVNWIDNNVIENCNIGLQFAGTDSRIVNNYITGSLGGGTADAILQMYGGVSFIGNELDNRTTGFGLVIQGPPASCGTNVSQNSVVGNVFQNLNVGIAFQIGACGSGLVLNTAVVGNTFHADLGDDITIDSGINDGNLTGNNFSSSTPSGAHISWSGTATGWTVSSNTFAPGHTPYTNLPADAIVIGGNASQLDSLRLFPTTIANLGSCSTTNQGQLKYVLDNKAAAAPVWHGVVTGGGSTVVTSIVACNSSVWLYD